MQAFHSAPGPRSFGRAPNPDELKEALLHLAFYAGWPNGMGATTVLKNVVEKEDR